MIWFIGLMSIGLALLFFAIPGAEDDVTLRPLNLPDDLDRYLRETETQYADIVPGTEKTILWANPETRTKTDVAIVYLHGFSATRRETAPLCEQLAAALGANLFYTRLRGHGRAGAAMGEATESDWLNDAVEAVEIGKRIGERVIVIGTSTGGTLATWLAANRPDKLLACVLISPNFLPAHWASRFFLHPKVASLMSRFAPETWTWQPVNEEHGRYWTTSHPMTAVFTMMRLVRRVRNAPLQNVGAAALMLYSPDDRVVNERESQRVFAKFGSSIKRRIAIHDAQDPFQHVLAGDILSPNVTERVKQEIFDFLTPLL